MKVQGAEKLTIQTNGGHELVTNEPTGDQQLVTNEPTKMEREISPQPESPENRRESKNQGKGTKNPVSLCTSEYCPVLLVVVLREGVQAVI